MSLDCPVCGYQQVEHTHCPNCDADLTALVSLAQLPQFAPPPVLTRTNLTPWVVLPLAVVLAVWATLRLRVPPAPLAVVISHQVSHVSPPTVAPRPPARKLAPPQVVYLVQPGDNLSAIAAKFGQLTTFVAIYQANPQLQPDPGRLQIGQKLVIPITHNLLPPARP